ncbi:sensor histidine kinase [Ramlibacter sp. PS4R-6]|uniref:sensor histidine kinase n=1 Tax=Ramlibacter sp. PS4R-6 TaxID=3133438 RepID=UPI0030B7559D
MNGSFVSTLQPASSHRKAALLAVLVSLVVFAAAAPFARLPLAQVPAFLPIYQSALVIFDMITAVLLLGQFRILRNRGLILLAAGYIFNALMATSHTLSFPGLFGPQGVIGGGGQTTAWIYYFWHAGFPLFVIGYAMLKPNGQQHTLGGSVRLAVYAAAVSAIALAAAMVLVATALHDILPPIMAGNTDAPGKIVVAVITWVLGLLALAAIWRRPPHTVLDLWLMVVLCVWSAETALASVLNGGRFDLGWYSGRIYGLLANGFVLAVLLLENGSLYARLAESNKLLAEKSEALEVTMSDLELANRDLQAFAGSLAHDLQQPLTTIAAFSQVMQRNADRMPAADVVNLGKITAAAATAKRMIRALLEFARLGQSQVSMARVDLNQVVGEARSAVMATESRYIEWRIAPLPAVHGDASLLLLAFINLLSNAVKYTRHQRDTVISIDAVPHPPDRYDVRVRDNGVGFDMTHAVRLFRPFERLHTAAEFEGTGMGLANVRRIMEKHGGSVRARSQLGAGAEFTLRLPSADEAPPPRKQGSSGSGSLSGPGPLAAHPT